MSDERIGLWGMVAVGVVVWAVGIGLVATWLMVFGAVVVAGGAFGLLRPY